MPRMPQVRAPELVRFLKSQGFIEDRQSGPLDPLARGAEDLRHHSDAHRSRYRAGTCDPYSQGRWHLGRGLSTRTPSQNLGSSTSSRSRSWKSSPLSGGVQRRGLKARLQSGECYYRSVTVSKIERTPISVIANEQGAPAR